MLKRIIVIAIGLLPLGIGLLIRVLEEFFGFLSLGFEFIIGMCLVVLWAAIAFNGPRYFSMKNEASLLLNIPGILILIVSFIFVEAGFSHVLIAYFLPLVALAAPIPLMLGLTEAMVFPFAVLLMLVVSAIAERVGRKRFPDPRYADYERHLAENKAEDGEDKS